MAKTVGYLLLSKIDSLNFTTTNTLRNQDVKLSSINGNYVIDVDGMIYEISPSTSSATVVIVGGLSTFPNEKEYREPVLYMTVNQILTVKNILKHLSFRTDIASVSGSTRDLDATVRTIYNNYCG